jgi:hypothetical protein
VDSFAVGLNIFFGNRVRIGWDVMCVVVVVIEDGLFEMPVI